MSKEKILKRASDEDKGSQMTFWFIRHAQSEGNDLDSDGKCSVNHNTPLTPEGKRQANALGEYLRKNDIDVDKIYTSPRGRSHETAEIIGEMIGKEVVVKEGLTERNWGEWKDDIWEDVSNKLDKMGIKDRYTFVPPGGESWSQMEDRLFAALEEIAHECGKEDNVMIVTHRGCFRSLFPLLDGADLSEHKSYSVKTGTITMFSFSEGGFSFLGLDPKED